MNLLVKDFKDNVIFKSSFNELQIQEYLLFLSKKNNPCNNFKIPIFNNNKHTMNYLISSKRFKAIFGIGIVAFSIGLISKKVISYPAGGCMKGTQELTFKKEINKNFI